MRITLLGSSSGRNAGDAALIRAIVEALRERLPDVRFEVPTIAPSFLRRHYPDGTVEPVAILPWNGSLKFLGPPTFRSVARTDATLVFDAILFDRSLWNPLFNYLSSLRLLLPWARRLGKRVVFYSVGVGPIHTGLGRRVLRDTLAAGDLFTIRDPDSLELARAIGLPPGKPVHLTADAALNHRPAADERIEAILRGLELPSRRPRVGVNVNAYLDTWAHPGGGRLERGRFVAAMASVADRMVREWDAAVIFFVTQHMDRRITEAVRGAMEEAPATRVLSNEDLSPEELQGAMGRMELFFGMRFHSLLLAASLATPIVGLVYQSKVASLFRQLGRPEGAIPFERFGLEEIWERLAACWEERAAIRERLRAAVAELKARALEAADATARCLGR